MPPLSSTKLPTALIRYLKTQAAMRGVPMYSLAEDFIAQGVGGYLWRHPAYEAPPITTNPAIRRALRRANWAYGKKTPTKRKKRRST